MGYFLLGSVTSDVSDKNILLFTVKKIRSLIIESCLSTGNVISDTFEKLKEKNGCSGGNKLPGKNALHRNISGSS